MDAVVSEAPSRSRLRTVRARLGAWWHLPTWAHVVALGAIVVALVPLVGTDASFTGDEGAAIIQAKMLADGEGWLAPNKLADVDPAGKAFGLAQSDVGSRGVAPFAKHPAYPLLLAGADRVGGATAMVLLSVAATLAAAALAGGLAARIDPRLVRPSIWVTGLASPLLFDGFTVIAHSLGAAFAAGAALSVLRFLDRHDVRAALGTIACVAGACALRNEALVFVVATAAVVGAVALARRDLRAAVLAVSAVAAAGLVQVADAIARGHIVGGRAHAFATPPSGDLSFPEARLLGFWATWLRPSRLPGSNAGDVLMLMVLATGLAAAWIVRRRPSDTNGIVLFAGVGGVAAAARLVVARVDLVPGLLVAFPLLWVALCLWDRTAAATDATRVLTAVIVFFALGVLAVQYPVGGFLEWGGRYFALGLPLAVPLVVHVLRGRRDRLDATARRAAVAGLVLCTAATAVLAVAALRTYHERFGGLVDDVRGAAGGGEPVIVTSEPLVARLAWSSYRHQRWLLTTDANLALYAARLRTSGVERLTLVSTRDRRVDDLQRVHPAYTAVRQYPPRDKFVVLAMRAR